MTKLIVLITAVALMAIMAAPVTAQVRMRGDYGRGPYCATDITKLPDLNLTDMQIKKLKVLRAAHLQDIKPFRDQMYSKSIELKGLWLEQTPDINKIETLQKEIKTLGDETLAKVKAYRFEIRKVLTAEQKEKLVYADWGRGQGFGSRGGVRDPGQREYAPGKDMLD